MHIATCKWLASSPPSPQNAVPFRGLFWEPGVKHRGLAPVLRTPSSPTHPLPLAVLLPSLIIALSAFSVVGRPGPGGRSLPHSHFDAVLFSHDLSAPLRLCPLGGTLDSFATCKYRGHSRFPSSAGPSVKHLGTSLPRRRPSSTSHLAPNRNSTPDGHRLACSSYTAPHPPPPLLVSAQQPSGLHNLPDTNQLLISLRPTQILSLINAVPKGAPNAPRPRERECPWPCSIFSRRRSPRASTCLESCLHPSCTLPSPSGTRPGRLIVSGSSDTTTPLSGVVSRQARTPAPISCVGAF